MLPCNSISPHNEAATSTFKEDWPTTMMFVDSSFPKDFISFDGFSRGQCSSQMLATDGKSPSTTRLFFLGGTFLPQLRPCGCFKELLSLSSSSSSPGLSTNVGHRCVSSVFTSPCRGHREHLPPPPSYRPRSNICFFSLVFPASFGPPPTPPISPSHRSGLFVVFAQPPQSSLSQLFVQRRHLPYNYHFYYLRFS